MPTTPTAARVAVWRQLKKMGAVYLQQSACVFPELTRIRRELQPILMKIAMSDGRYHLLPLRSLPDAEHAKLIAEFQDQSAKQFQEIIDNCEINFQKEIDFETFRGNFTYEEAEEIRLEFEKIVNWFEGVSERDWFQATNKDEAQEWLNRCEALLEGFEEKVFQFQADADKDPFATTRPVPRHRKIRALPGGRSAMDVAGGG